MKVLLVSHTVLSKTGNMGKTLRGYLADFAPEDIAQFYIHSEVPTDDTRCTNYYRFTDVDALKSIWPFQQRGVHFGPQDIQPERTTTRTDSGAVGEIYQFGRKRSGGIYLMRNLLWKLGHWKTPKLKAWLREVDPDVILFASGDYSFMYDIARWMAEFLNKPLVVSCMDDYYIYNANQDTAIGRFQHKLYLNTVRRTMDRASCILAICDSMRDAYAELFQKPCYVLHTSAEEKTLTLNPNAQQLSYLGNLGFDRNLQLCKIGRAAKKIGRWVDVYSGEKNPEILSVLTEENGIRYHGSIPASEVLKVMEQSMVVIHTEAFDEKNKQEVRFSVSTKIAESLMYGPCLLAFGPEGIASIDYLKQNRAAYVITREEDLTAGLQDLTTNAALRKELLENARALARKNHSSSVNPQKVRAWLQAAAEGKGLE